MIQISIKDVLREIDLTSKKFPLWPTDPMHALAIVHEEFGELTQAILQYIYEPEKKTTMQDIRKETIQTAAMILRFAASLETYEYEECHRHQQLRAYKK